MALEVRDSLSNSAEQIEEIAKTIGRGARRQVFEAAYYHKKPIKTVGEIAESAGLSRMRVLQEAQHLHQKHILIKTKKDGELAYQTVPSIQARKKEILRLAGSPTAIAKYPTKRKLKFAGPLVVRVAGQRTRATPITVDDITSFRRVKTKRQGENLPESVSEDEFRQGVQRVLGERGVFKDWGGENSDLYSTRLMVGGRRRRVAFAFKGPGMKRKLVPGLMGKRGDQLQRMFRLDADVFIAQHWREIDESVPELMQKLAAEKSVSSGRRIWYGIIDGQDSQRLRLAYPKEFKAD